MSDLTIQDLRECAKKLRDGMDYLDNEPLRIGESFLEHCKALVRGDFENKNLLFSKSMAQGIIYSVENGSMIVFDDSNPFKKYLNLME